MTTNALMELAACPFCGGPADFVMQTPRKWSVNCMHNACVEMGMSEDKKELAKLWNTRTQLRTAAAEGETLSESDKDVAVAQAVDLAEYVERQAKGTMVDAARKFLSLPYAQEIKARLTPTNSGAGRDAVHPHEKGFCIRDPGGWYLIENGEILTFADKNDADHRCEAMNTDPLRYLSQSTISENGGAFGFVCIWRRGSPDKYRKCTVGEWLSDPENQSGEWLVDGGWGGPPGPWVIAWDEAAKAWR